MKQRQAHSIIVRALGSSTLRAVTNRGTPYKIIVKLGERLVSPTMADQVSLLTSPLPMWSKTGTVMVSQFLN